MVYRYGTESRLFLWGEVPSTQSLLCAFNTVTEDRLVQDVGFDGLNDQEERLYMQMDPVKIQ